MKCPKCEVIELTMTDRSGVEIDYCAACRGVWLDRGELDKIIERSAVVVPTQVRPVQPEYRDYERGRDREYDRDDDDDDRRRYKKRKSSFLGELFDF